MAKKRKGTIKVAPPTNLPSPKADVMDIPFHIGFPVELHHLDNGEKKTCWFKDMIDCKKYITRYKLKSNQFTIRKTNPK
jgi:hypothetical protein